MKDFVINLVGPSGSGKTTICKRFEKLGVNVVKSLTTRKPRYADEYGHTFISGKWVYDNELVGFSVDGGVFVPVSDIVSYLDAYGCTYLSTKDQYIGKGLTINTVDSTGAERTKKVLTKTKVITVYLMVGREERMARMMKEMRTDVVHRLQTDHEMFNLIKCDYVVDGERPVDEIVETIIDLVGEYNVL